MAFFMSQAGDPNMSTALSWAEELGDCPDLPDSLKEVGKRVQLINAINAPLILDLNGNPSLLYQISFEEKQRRFDQLGQLSKDYMPDISDETERINIVLRLWSGCLSAAKSIAVETQSGPNDSAIRRSIFTTIIDPTARSDKIYSAGVESAPAFKRLLKQQISFDGVPNDSPVRKKE